MATKDLIVIESSKKIKALAKILRELDRSMSIRATLGRLYDIQPIDPEEFVSQGRVQWRAIRPDLVQGLTQEIAQARRIYVATDSDIEGEVIAWHVQRLAEEAGKSSSRIHVRALTKEGIEQALSSPGELDIAKAEGGVARRVFDNFGQFALDNETIQRKPYLKGTISRVSTPLIQSAISNPLAPTRFKRTLPISNVSAVVRVPSNMDPKTVEWKIRALPAPVLEVEGTEEKKLSEGLNLADCMDGFSKALKCDPSDIYDSLEDLHDNGLVTYFRTDSRRMSPGSVNDLKKGLAAAGVKTGGLEANTSRGKQDAHEAIIPLGMQGNPFDKIQHQSKSDAVLSLLWRHYAMIGAGYRIRTEKSKLSGYAAENQGWSSLQRKGVKLSFQRSEAFVSDGSAPKEWDPEFVPFGVKAGSSVSKDWVKLNLSDQQLAVERMIEEGLGRPSTLGSLSKGVARRFLSQGVVNRVGWASLKEAGITAPRLGIPDVAREIEASLHEGRPGETITDRVYRSLISSEWIRATEKEAPAPDPREEPKRQFVQSFDM